MSVDRGQTKNVIDEHPTEAEKLAVGYEKRWQSFMDEGVNERYAYIKVGSPHENPSRISAHDLSTGKYRHTWHQYGAATASQSTGRWKIEFVEDGEYKISLCRFPRESGLGINATFPAQKPQVELDRIFPASNKSDFAKAYIYVANLKQTKNIEAGEKEVRYTGGIAAGKYDMQAQLIDKDGRVYPAYHVYIEKL